MHAFLLIVLAIIVVIYIYIIIIIYTLWHMSYIIKNKAISCISGPTLCRQFSHSSVWLSAELLAYLSFVGKNKLCNPH